MHKKYTFSEKLIKSPQMQGTELFYDLTSRNFTQLRHENSPDVILLSGQNQVYD
jgi:hypothetical protein